MLKVAIFCVLVGVCFGYFLPREEDYPRDTPYRQQLDEYRKQPYHDNRLKQYDAYRRLPQFEDYRRDPSSSHSQHGMASFDEELDAVRGVFQQNSDAPEKSEAPEKTKDEPADDKAAVERKSNYANLFSDAEEDATPEVSSLKNDATPELSSLKKDAIPELSSLKKDAIPEVSSFKKDATPEVGSLERDATPEVGSPKEDSKKPNNEKEIQLRQPNDQDVVRRMPYHRDYQYRNPLAFRDHRQQYRPPYDTRERDYRVNPLQSFNQLDDEENRKQEAPRQEDSLAKKDFSSKKEAPTKEDTPVKQDPSSSKQAAPKKEDSSVKQDSSSKQEALTKKDSPTAKKNSPKIVDASEDEVSSKHDAAPAKKSIIRKLNHLNDAPKQDPWVEDSKMSEENKRFAPFDYRRDFRDESPFASYGMNNQRDVPSKRFPEKRSPFLHDMDYRRRSYNY